MIITRRWSRMRTQWQGEGESVAKRRLPWLTEALEDVGIQCIREGHSGGIRVVFQGHSGPKQGIQDFGNNKTKENVWVLDMR